MAKMAELHAQLEEYDEIEEREEPTCNWCGDTIDDCRNAGECPGPWA